MLAIARVHSVSGLRFTVGWHRRPTGAGIGQNSIHGRKVVDISSRVCALADTSTLVGVRYRTSSTELRAYAGSMHAPRTAFGENRLIAALPSAGRHSLLSRCDQVDLGFAEVLVQAGEECRYVYFPTDSFISVIAALESEARLEVGIVGDEGMLGASLVLGVSVSPLHAVVQGAGPAWRISAAEFRNELVRSEQLRTTLQRYIYVLMGQFAQAAICIRYHVVQARLARWLLMTRDRAHSRQFFLTHEFLADMLGVRRVGITTAAKSLARRKVIDYSRGTITILDGAALEAASCECYEKEKAMHREILGTRRRAIEIKARRPNPSLRADPRGK